MKKLFLTLAITALLATPIANAQYTYTLTDLNTVVTIDSEWMVHDWMVDGASQLYQQGFWFGIGDNAETMLGNGDLLDFEGTQFGDAIVKLEFTYELFTAEITYMLYGGSDGSHVSDIAETIRLTNTSDSTIDMRFFQYSDFDLGGTTDDIMTFTNDNTVTQVDAGGTSQLSETVVTPSADHYEGALYSDTFDSLEDGYMTTLSDTPSVGNSISGDVTWAYQWDRSIVSGGTFLISKDKRLGVVPEPGTVLLLGLGLLGAGISTLRRRRNS